MMKSICTMSWLALLLAGSVRVSGAEVEITGGLDKDDPYRYVWTVTNNGTLPIVYFEVPHFRGNVATPPIAWESVVTQQNGVTPGEVVEGVWMCECKVPECEFPPGQSREFWLTIATRGGSTPQKRTAIIKFADGTRVEVPGVECPIQEPWYSRYVMPLGMGAMFLVFLLVQVIRGGRKQTTASAATAESGDGG